MTLCLAPGAMSGDCTAPVLSLDVPGVARGGTPVLGPVRLAVAPRETLAIVGPSGIGKTTLLRVVAGLLPTMDGHCAVRGTMALVFQEPRLLPWCTLSQNLCVTTGIAAAEAAEWLDEAGLPGRAGSYPGELSLGQARRVAIVRAFAMRPALLLMDEPFASLDPDTAARMMDLFVRLRARSDVATLFVTHADDEAQALATRIVRLGGSPATVTGDTQNRGAYFQLSASGVTSSGS